MRTSFMSRPIIVWYCNAGGLWSPRTLEALCYFPAHLAVPASLSGTIPEKIRTKKAVKYVQ
jgi:hypothetical protein